jgi:dipeptidase E
MKYYLSSYRIGNKVKKLRKMLNDRSIGYVPNAIDYVAPKVRKEKNRIGMKELADIGIAVELLDLKKYFGKEKELKKRIDKLGGVWVRGGNVFVLRQAMRLSGFDGILKNMHRRDFVYGGYSAGGCVLSKDLRFLQVVDDPTIMPYKTRKVIWKGLGLISFAFLPHYESDHPESRNVDKAVKYCRKNKIPFKALRDGEVIIIE